MKSTNKNFIFNVGYQLLMYLFPLLSAAYVSRILGSQNLGTYSYVNSIGTLCGMFGMLGISNYGNREVAKARDQREELSKIFSSIYTLQLILSFAVIICFSVTIICLPIENKTLYVIQILHLLSIAFDISWLFFGLEKFKTTLTRNFVVKCISTVLIFLLVKTEKDLWIYALIMSMSTLFSQLILHILMRREVDFKVVGITNAFHHLKKVSILFIPVIAFSIYRIMDKTMLGALSPKEQLGYYDNAERIINIPIMVISALGTVMMPHMSHLMKNGEKDYKGTLSFSMKLALNIATFSACGLFALGKDIALVMFGSEYITSGYLIMLLSVTILASAWANVIRTQFLIPKNYDKIYVMSTLIGALINLVFNSILIKPYGAYGACLGTILAEFSICVIQTVSVKKYVENFKYLKIFVIALSKAIFSVIIVWSVGILIDNLYLRLCVQLILAVLLFVVLNCKFIFLEFIGIKLKKH